MGRYIIRRLLQAIPLLFFVSVAMFLLIHAMPGGPAAVLQNNRLTGADRAAQNAAFGLDKPLYIQYFFWLGHALVGDFGFSFANFQPVSSTIAARFPATLELFGYALILALIVAIVIGTISGVRQKSVTDYTLTTVAYFGIAMPIFLFGILAQDIFGVWLHVLPTSGTQTLGYSFDAFNGFLDHLTYLLLPVLVLSITFIATWSRYMRSSVIEVSKQDYIRTARAKGVSPVPLLMRHALRNAVIPLITVVAIDFGQVAGGAAITESVFAWPGMGQLFISSLSSRDFPVLLAMLLIGAVFVIVFNLLADILYAVMDPRIRYS
ncbi:MAG: ABC transporter permease [Chloroflexota bacterium]|nr:ABC transporter permease [Chloroflexota bacterium]